ncbi:hypothetical protein JCM11251_003775 [Rhodosporidiobolus azoricus]
MAPTIDVFVTTILSNPAIRGRHERVKRALTSARVAYAEHDVAGDEAAKSMWKRKNGGKNELPFILVDGEPVGSIEDLDEAVEFGELRQFLRLDTPAAPPAPPAPTASSSSSASNPPRAPTSSSSAMERKPTLDDFAALNLSASELAELERELAQGETFSSGLVHDGDPIRQGFNFSSSATQHFEPVFAPTEPLKLEKVNFERPLPDWPLASEVVRDELDGLGADGLGEDELEKLVREMEAEEEERRRLRDAQGEEGRGVEPPPLPEKKGGEESEPSLPAKDLSHHNDDELANTTSIPGAGGAALSAPLAQVDRLDLSSAELASLHSNPPPSSTLTVSNAPSSPSASSSPHPLPSLSSPSLNPPPTPPTPKRKTSKKAADALKEELHKAVEGHEGADPERLKAVGGSMAVSELPSFDSTGPGAGRQKEEERGGIEREEGEREKREARAETVEDGLADRVAEAIRGGDL